MGFLPAWSMRLAVMSLRGNAVGGHTEKICKEGSGWHSILVAGSCCRTAGSVHHSPCLEAETPSICLHKLQCHGLHPELPPGALPDQPSYVLLLLGLLLQAVQRAQHVPAPHSASPTYQVSGAHLFLDTEPADREVARCSCSLEGAWAPPGGHPRPALGRLGRRYGLSCCCLRHRASCTTKVRE